MMKFEIKNDNTLFIEWDECSDLVPNPDARDADKQFDDLRKELLKQGAPGWVAKAEWDENLDGAFFHKV